MQSKSNIVGEMIGTLLLLSAILMTGCQSTTPLMPTPNLYAWGKFDPFADVPPELQNNHVEVLYLTDRAAEGTTKTGVQYGYKRSRSVAFGVSEVDIGKDVSWNDLVKASRTAIRVANLDLSVARTTALARFPATPRSVLPSHRSTTAQTSEAQTSEASNSEASTELASIRPLLGEDLDADEQAAEAVVHRELSARLAITPVKDVYLFVHGFDNTFDDSVETIAELWHFFGRQGVPIAYSWPAGSKGLLRGYEADTASSEFTVVHLKQMLRVIARCPDVKRIHIIAHSRGTDTAISALRELHMELRAMGENTRESLKLGTLVLAAPDIDVDTVLQKFTTVRLGLVPEHFAMYINSKDKALGLSSWLTGGLERLGELKASMFTPEELEQLRASNTVQIIDARVTNPGDFGHDYYHANPAVSSDLILLMRYQLPPGGENNRPLRVTDNGFWAIDDGYPGPPKDMNAEATGK